MCHSSLIDLRTKETKLSLLSSSTTTGLRFRKFHNQHLGVTFFSAGFNLGRGFIVIHYSLHVSCVSSPPDVDVMHNRRYWGFSGGCSRMSLVSAFNNVSLISRVFSFSNRLLRSCACKARIWGSCGSYSSADHAVPAVRKIMAEKGS